MSVIEKQADGSFKLAGPVIFSCGCGDVVPQAKRMLSMSGVGAVPLVMTNTTPNAKKYIKQVGLTYICPAIKKGRHSVLFNPNTGQFINLLKAPQTSKVYENIFKVVEGIT